MRISLLTRVVNISRDPSGGHIVSYVRRQPESPDKWETEPQIIHAAYVALCTGLHVIPSVPTIEGIEHVLRPLDSDERVQPTAFHSVDYKSRSQLAGRKVMVLGTGETGMDIAYEAAKAGAQEVVLCSRSGCVYISMVISFRLYCRGQISLVSESLGTPTPDSNLRAHVYLHIKQNDFSMFGFKFESKTPVPIDSLITNLAETAYVVSFT
jgi:dimethylaniline monooxygenase (N-oxide forming)